MAKCMAARPGMLKSYSTLAVFIEFGVWHLRQRAYAAELNCAVFTKHVANVLLFGRVFIFSVLSDSFIIWCV